MASHDHTFLNKHFILQILLQTSAKGSVPPITMLGRNLSIPTGDGNASFRGTNDASVVMRYEVIDAYPV